MHKKIFKRLFKDDNANKKVSCYNQIIVDILFLFFRKVVFYLMKKFISKTRKVVTCILTAAMVMTSVVPTTMITANAASSMSVTEAAGWFETAYVKWAPVSGATGYRAYVKKASEPDSSYVQLDDQLIRAYKGYMRADALGLSAGSYVMHVEAVMGNGSVVSATTQNISVIANDRSGFAFSSKSVYKTASGAYNDDGTLKSNAQVVYVTPETAKTCTAVVNGAKVTGFQSILDAKQSAGTKDTSPIDFRIIGCIRPENVDHFSSSSEGIQVKGKSANSEMNITIEGVGDDASVYGFGFLIRNCGNLEIRNIGVLNFMDDGISIDSNNTNIWVHNVDIFYGSAGSDKDQAKGDGSVDIKGKSTDVTVSYVHFWDSGKCSLCGMSDSEEFRVTYHHNWFDHSDSRHARIRVASVHLYNNYFDGNAKYGVGTTKGSSAFVEANYFNNCHYPMMSSLQGTDALGEGTFSGEAGGMIKAYNNLIYGAASVIYANSTVGTAMDSKSFDAVLVEKRTDKVPNNFKTVGGGTVYNNFDTDSNYDLGVSTSKIDNPSKVPSVVKQYAGRMNGGDLKWTFGADAASSYTIDAGLKNAVVGYLSSLLAIGGNGSAAAPQTQPTTQAATQPATQPATQATTQATQATTAAAKTIADGWYYIKNVNAQKYLQVEGNKGANSVNVEIGTGTGVAGQKWCVTNLGNGYVTLKNGNGYMLDVQYGAIDNGVNIQTYQNNNADAQQFKIVNISNGIYGITTKVTSDSKALDVYNFATADGTNVCQWDYAAGVNQQWIFESTNAPGSSSTQATTQATTAATQPATQATQAATQAPTQAVTQNNVSGVKFTNVGGWLESIYAQISGVADANVTEVSYSGSASGTLKGDDFKYLVRDNNGGVRIDIPGLKPGTYTLTVKTTKGTISASGLVVTAYDRSGYAHYNYTAGVGAYNDNGTLKSNAIVLYVTNDNKDTVSVTSKDGTKVTGIGNILNSAGQNTGSGKTSNGGTPNTNAGIIKKLAADGTPLVIRFIGTVKAPKGLTAYDSVNYGGSVGDNGFMARMKSGKDITIEGIGYDAVIDGWGFHFMAESGAPNYGKSFEARNLIFKNTPEDAIGMEGVQDGSTITASVERCWVHNNEFYVPHISNPAESDKAEGDGSCDFKRGQYFTNSYNYYEGCHKTNLVGSSDTSLQFNLSYHHNYWKYCKARGPLARQANIHMYNNIFEGQTDYAMNTRANAYIYSEYNLFYMVKSPQRVDGGAIKSYNDSFASCINLMQATVVTNKSTKVSSGNKYENFDTNSSLSYIPSGNYQLQTNITDAAKYIYAYTGVMDQNPVRPYQVTDAMVSRVPADKYPTSALSLPYSQTTSEKVSKTVKAFKLNSGADITVAYSSNDLTATGVLVNEVGQVMLTGSGKVTVPAGVYMIQPMNFSAGSASALGTFKEVTITSLKIVANGSVVTPATTQATTKATQPATQATTKATQPATTQAATQATTQQTAPVVAESEDTLIHNFTKSGTTSSFYSITGNTSTSKGTVNYNGLTLTKALKMESSTTVKFTNSRKGVLTLVFVEANTSGVIKVDGKTYASDANGIVKVELAAGSHTISKANTANLFYIVLEMESAKKEAIHNFTKSSLSSDFFTIAGNMSTSKGTVNYNGLTLTKCLKMESATTVGFTAPKAGKLTLVFVEANNTTAVKIDGKTYASDSKGVVTVDLGSGSHSITKSGSTNLFYISFVY